MNIPRSAIEPFGFLGIPMLREGYTTDMSEDDERLHAGRRIIENWNAFQFWSSETVCDALIDAALHFGCHDVTVTVSKTHHRLVYSYTDYENSVMMTFPIRNL